jgi:hypothetical protein
MVTFVIVLESRSVFMKKHFDFHVWVSSPLLARVMCSDLRLSPEQVVWAPGLNLGLCFRALLLLNSFTRVLFCLVRVACFNLVFWHVLILSGLRLSLRKILFRPLILVLCARW